MYVLRGEICFITDIYYWSNSNYVNDVYTLLYLFLSDTDKVHTYSLELQVVIVS